MYDIFGNPEDSLVNLSKYFQRSEWMRVVSSNLRLLISPLTVSVTFVEESVLLLPHQPDQNVFHVSVKTIDCSIKESHDSKQKHCVCMSALWLTFHVKGLERLYFKEETEGCQTPGENGRGWDVSQTETDKTGFHQVDSVGSVSQKEAEWYSAIMLYIFHHCKLGIHVIQNFNIWKIQLFNLFKHHFVLY